MGLVAPRHEESSWTSDRTCLPCTGRQILIDCTTREVPPSFFFKTCLEYHGMSESRYIYIEQMNDSLDGDYHSLHFIYEVAETQKS